MKEKKRYVYYVEFYEEDNEGESDEWTGLEHEEVMFQIDNLNSRKEGIDFINDNFDYRNSILTYKREECALQVKYDAYHGEGQYELQSRTFDTIPEAEKFVIDNIHNINNKVGIDICTMILYVGEDDDYDDYDIYCLERYNKNESTWEIFDQELFKEISK